MPAQPTAHFVMVKTDFAFVFLKNGFNGPAHPADAHELDQGSFDRGIAKVELDHGRIIQIAADDQPDFGPGKFARDSIRRRKAKSQTIGPLLPSLIVAVVQASGWDRQEPGHPPEAGGRFSCANANGWGGDRALSTRADTLQDAIRQIRVEHLISVKYHLFSAATPSRKAGESPYNSSAATH